MGGSEICGGLKRLLWIIGNTHVSLAALRALVRVVPQKVKTKSFRLEKEGMQAEGTQPKARGRRRGQRTRV